MRHFKFNQFYFIYSFLLSLLIFNKSNILGIEISIIGVPYIGNILLYE